MDDGLSDAGARPRLAWGLAAAVVVSGLGWLGWYAISADPAEPTFCTADGYVTDDGTRLSRDHDQGCAWVGPDGERWPLDDDDAPTG